MSDQTPPVKLTAKQKRDAEAARIAKDAETVKTGLMLPEGATDEQRFGSTLLRRAQDLRHQHDEIVKQRGANRDMLRGMGTQNLLTDEQKSAVEVFYPTPKPRNDADEQATTPPVTPPVTPPAAPPTAKPAPQKSAA